MTDFDPNDPTVFDQLPEEEQQAVLTWIRDHIAARKAANNYHTSYGLKHLLDRDMRAINGVGLYVCNGAFKGAMLVAGFHPVDASEINWRFRIRGIK